MGEFRTQAGSDERVADWVRTFPELTGRTFVLEALRHDPHLQTRLFKAMSMLMQLAHIPDEGMGRYLIGLVAADQEAHLRRWQERLHASTGNSAAGNQLISVFRNVRKNAHYWQTGNKPFYRATDTVRHLPERDLHWKKTKTRSNRDVPDWQQVTAPIESDAPEWVVKSVVMQRPRDMASTTVSTPVPAE